MQSLNVLDRQIRLTEQLSSIVATMKTLSSVSIRQYETARVSLDHYYRTVEMGLHHVLRQGRQRRIGRRAGSKPRRCGAIVLGSDHGLCGRFNAEICRVVVQHLRATGDTERDWRVMALGARAFAGLESIGVAATDTASMPASVEAITKTVEAILQVVDRWQTLDDVDEVVLAYNHLVDAGRIRPHLLQLMPVDPQHFEDSRVDVWPTSMIPLTTLGHGKLLAALLREYFFVLLFRGCAESLGSEHAARLAAMRRAQENIDERLSLLRNEHRYQRQAAITAEVLELSSGYQVSSKPWYDPSDLESCLDPLT